MYPLGHFAFGAAMTTLMVTLLLPSVTHPRLLVTMGGLWAVVPDVGRVVAHPLLVELPLLHGADVFWLHNTLSTYLLPTDPISSTAAMVLLFAVVTMVAEVREVIDAPPITSVVEERAEAIDEWLHGVGPSSGGWTVFGLDRER